MKFWGVIVTFVVGIALGVGGTIYGPELVAPYLPDAMQRSVASIEGKVITKKRESDRLLLMVQTLDGSILASFKKNVAEIELLVSEGDLITFLLKQYKPFVDDPVIGKVRNQEPAKQMGGESSLPEPEKKEQAPQ